MPEGRYVRLNEKIDRALKEKRKRSALYEVMKRGRNSRNTAVAALPKKEAFRKEVRAIKLRCQERAEALVDQFSKQAGQRGAHVFLAHDGPAAIDYILRIARRRGAKVVAKSKSLTSEEIEVNAPMEAAGMDVIETDLGELIIQKADEKPFHLVFPAIHKTIEEVAEIFEETTGQDVPTDVNLIMKTVRRYLRPIFLNADIGMTGANVGIAETGTIVIETNEGNARLVSSIPDVHICIMGREKIVETVEDALQMMLAHPISAVGQHLTTYVTVMGGRSPLGRGEAEAGRESHIIILDNGRTRMQQDPLFRDALNCIRCGACMNICPTYGVVGGHTFGHIYPGPIGIPWTAEVHGLEKAGDFAPLCISCGLCQEICPAEIDIPMMIAAVKDRDSEFHPHPAVNRALMAAESLAKFGSATAPFSNWILNRPAFRWALEVTVGLDRRRRLPPFRRRTLWKRFKNRRAPTPRRPARRVAFFADIYFAYNAPDLGMAAVELLEARHCEVVLPDQKACGYPYIGYGDLKRAKSAADRNVGLLAPYVAQGYDIVAAEPTAAYTLRKCYPKLLESRADSLAVAGRTYELFEFLGRIEEEDGGAPEPDPSLSGRRFGFHIPCHQRPLGAGKQTMAYLRKRGAQLALIETGTCCGMGGTFGLKKGLLGYELSQAVGEPLFAAFRDTNLEAIVTESSVCTIQLSEGTGLEVRHPLELLGKTESSD